MSVELIFLVCVAIASLFFPDRVVPLTDSLTTIHYELCHLAPIIKTDIGSREGEVSTSFSCDPIVRPDDSGLTPFIGGHRSCVLDSTCSTPLSKE